MKLFLSIVLMSLVFPVFAAEQSKYIGYKHKGVVSGAKLPNGVKDLGGGLLADENFGVSRFSKGKKYMLWLEKIASRDENGVPDWEVKDVLTFKKLKKTAEFFLGLSSPCVQKGRQNLNLIVQAELLPDNTYKITNAWKANLKKAKFEETSTKKIVCAADGDDKQSNK